MTLRPRKTAMWHGRMNLLQPAQRTRALHDRDWIVVGAVVFLAEIVVAVTLVGAVL
jgi:hypothetical protein